MTTVAAPPTASEKPVVDLGIDLDSETLTVLVSGVVDVTTVAAFRRRLLTVVATAGPRTVAVDLTAAELRDPTGAAVLVQVQHYCRQHGGDLRLVLTPGSATERVLVSTGLQSAFSHRPGWWPGHPDHDLCSTGQ